MDGRSLDVFTMEALGLEYREAISLQQKKNDISIRLQIALSESTSVVDDERLLLLGAHVSKQSIPPGNCNSGKYFQAIHVQNRCRR